MTAEIRGVDLILSLVPKMNRHEVPSYYGSHANNTTKGLRFGSIIFGKFNMPSYNKTCQNSLQSMFCVGQTRIRNKSQMSRLCGAISRRCHTKLTVPSAAPKQLLRCVNPNQWKTGRSGSNLRLCGENWPISSTFSSLMEMTKVHLSSQCLTPAHKSSALKIEDTVSENLCSNLPPLEVDKHLPLFHLICLFLVFLLKCCNGFSLKPAQPMCDGRLFASSPFSRLASRGALFCRFPCRWVLFVVLSLTRRVLVHDATPCSREDS